MNHSRPKNLVTQLIIMITKTNDLIRGPHLFVKLTSGGKNYSVAIFKEDVLKTVRLNKNTPLYNIVSCY